MPSVEGVGPGSTIVSVLVVDSAVILTSTVVAMLATFESASDVVS
jgi:hypothetical protein